jgi:hypothetical protein
MIEHTLKWTAPAPLWAGLANATDTAVRRKFNQPTILRFAADSFMEDFMKLLDSDPAQLASLVVERETWREPLSNAQTDALLEPAPQLSKFARKLSRVRLATERLRNGSSLSFTSDTTSAQRPLKLYQPAHQRYYLVAAHLVCGITGLPDHTINADNQERVSFVVRRLLPPVNVDPKQNLPTPDSTWDEYAMVNAATGKGWQKVSGPGTAAAITLVPGEETLPLFAMSFSEDDGRRRKLLAGLVPTGKREVYMGASQRAVTPASGQATEKPVDPRMVLFWSQVTEPWKRLVETAFAARKNLTTPATPAPTDAEKKSLLKVTREQAQISSWYTLLDFAKLLKEQMPNVWQSLMGQPITVPLQTSQIDLIAALTQTIIGGSEAEAGNYANRLVSDKTDLPFTRTAAYTTDKVLHTLKDALIKITGGLPYTAQKETDVETRLETVTAPFNREDNNALSVWLPFLFPFADIHPNNFGPLPPKKPGVTENPDPLLAALDRIDYFAELIEKALPSLPSTALAPLPLAAQPPVDTREGWFVIRCIFERPNCGPLEPPVVSEATRAFQIAGFFDPDAPARPIRIALPIDTSPAGFRKFDKNTAFMISDILCGQIDRMKGITLGDLVLSVLPWPFHKDLSVPEKGPCTTKGDPGLQAGMICSLSIPIITICALLLLMIIVSLLDFIFKWIPYFLICFPLPGFKAKK